MTLWRILGRAARQRAAADAAATRTRFLAAIRAMGTTVLVLDADGGVVAATDGLGLFPAGPPKTAKAAADALGGTPDVCEAIRLARAVSEDLREECRPDAPVFAVPAMEAGGGVRWFSLSAERPAGSGEVVLAFCEITQTRSRFDRLERQLALMNRALERAPFGFVVLDEAGTIRDTNTAFCRLIGGQPAGGKRFADLFIPKDGKRVSALIKTLEEAPSDAPAPGPQELRLDGEEERVVTVYANCTVLSDRDRQGVLIHAIDATERKQLETQFARFQKMQAVGQLAGGIAHDFNNVLTAITGFCDLLLQRHHPGDPSFADVMQIQQNANRAAGLTRQLLAFSRQQTIRSHVVDVADMLAELSNLLHRLLGENVELSIVHGRDLWPARGDYGQLEQIVINLAINARDAMPKGGRLTIRTDNFSSDRPYQMREELMPPGDYVMLAVSDTGIGMAPDVLERIFEPFFTTKEVGQGTGLGLAMVCGSVSQMDGFVVAHSEGAGMGASFSLYLPRATTRDHDAAAENAARRKAEVLDDTGGERILLVEDEDAIRLFSARALRSKGYDVTEARTGEVALEFLNDRSFDLLVTDLVMPKVDGATLIREARKAMPRLPVICISGYTRDSVAREVTELPLVSVLSKPFSLRQLAVRVRMSLESVRRKAGHDT